MARDFDAVDDYISATITALDSGDWTIWGWIKPDGAGESGAGRIVGIMSGGVNNRQNFITIAGVDLEAQQSFGTTVAVTSANTNLTTGQWAIAFAKFTASDNTIRIYVGDLDSPVAEATYNSQTAGAGTRHTGGTDCFIGNRTASGDRTFDGAIAEVGVAARALSLDEMEAIRLGTRPVQTGSLRGFWPLDSPTAAQAEDLSGNGAHGTVSGATAVEGPPVPTGWGASPSTVLAPVDGSATPAPAVVAAVAAVPAPTIEGSSAFYVASGSNTGESATASVTIPAAAQENDLAVMVVGTQADRTVTTPTGWTLVTSKAHTGATVNYPHIYVFRRVLQAGDPGGSASATISTSGNWNAGISVYRGIDTANPIGAVGTAQPGGGTDSSTASITTSVDNVMLVTAHAAVHATGSTQSWTPQGALTERVDQGRKFNALSMNEEEQATAGASGAKTTRLSFSNTSHVNVIVEVRPADAASGDVAPVAATVATATAVPAPTISTGAGGSIVDQIAKAGGQTVVVPNGTYTGGTSTVTHSDFLVLKAQTQGGVVVSDTAGLILNGATKVIFVGFKFENTPVSVRNASADIAFWYCEGTYPAENWPGGSAPYPYFCRVLSTGSGTPARVDFLGCDIHDCGDDGIQFGSSTGCEIAGCKISRIDEKTYDPADAWHNDTVQLTGQSTDLFMHHTEFGGPDDGPGGTGDGHVQVKCDIGAITNCRIEDSWMRGAKNYGIILDSRKSDGSNVSLTGSRTRIYSWNHNFGDRANFGTQVSWTDTDVTTSAPPGGTESPADVWRGANPYDTYGSYFGLAWEQQGATPGPSPAAAAATVPAPTVDTGSTPGGGDATPTPSAVAAAAGVDAPLALGTSTVATPDPVAAVADAPDVVPSLAALPDATAATASVPTPTISTRNIFRPPVDKLAFAPPLHHWRYDRGRTVLKKGGEWKEGTGFEWDDLASADALPAGDESQSSVPGRYAWLGGYEYEVSATISTELQGQGYSVS